MDLQPGWQTLADVVTRRRKQLGLTQEEVAAKGGPSTATIRSIESAAGSSYRSRTLLGLDAALGWLSGTSNALVRGLGRSSDWDFADYVDWVIEIDPAKAEQFDNYEITADAARTGPASARVATRPPVLQRLRALQTDLASVIRQLEGELDDEAQEPRTQTGGQEHGGAGEGESRPPTMMEMVDALVPGLGALRGESPDYLITQLRDTAANWDRDHIVGGRGDLPQSGGAST